MSIRSSIKSVGKKARKVVKKVGRAVGKYVAPALPIVAGAALGPGGVLLATPATLALGQLGASGRRSSALKTGLISTGASFAASGALALIRGTGFLQSPFAAVPPKPEVLVQAGKANMIVGQLTGNPALAMQGLATPGVAPSLAAAAQQGGGVLGSVLKGVGTTAVSVGTQALTGVLKQGTSTQDVMAATQGVAGPVGWPGSGGGGLTPTNFGLFPQPGEAKLGETGIPGSGGFGGSTLGAPTLGEDGSRGVSPVMLAAALGAAVLLAKAA